ncbi:tRNA-binding protein [Thermoproteota archaeon]
MISYGDFQKLEIRTGKIIEVKDFPQAINPSYKLRIDFGKDIGIKKSCAQATNYVKEELFGRQVICVVNFPPKQIASAVSEVLVLGVPTESKGIALLRPDKEAVLGSRVY